LELNPRSFQAQFQLGLILNELGQSEEALAHLNEAVRLQADSVPILWHTAWILATDPDPLIREGARAVELAKQAVELSQGQDLQALDALAAALAETGQFSAAADVAWQASMTAMAQSKIDLSTALAGRVRLYRQQLPYRQPPKAAGQQESPSGEAPTDAGK
jgi:tetratricopeptide (TPR) repeat protein